MSLRFQANDEVDRNIKHGPFSHWIVMVLIAAPLGVGEVVGVLLAGGARGVHGKNIFGIAIASLAIVGVMTLTEQKFSEFRLRAKETYGKVSAIEEAIADLGTAQSETLKRLDAIEAVIAGLQPTPVQPTEDSDRGTVEELYERIVELRVQVKLARLFARIEDDLRELRRNLTAAQFAREGEKGFIPQEVLNSGRGFKFPASENEARLMAAMALDIIEEGLDYFETDKWGTADFALSFSRCMSLESLQEEVREAASKSRSASLNEICSSLSWIHDRVNTIRESAAYARLEKRAEQGDASAQYELGIAYRDGQHGIQDYEEAYYWLYLAVTANFATKDVGAEAVTGARDDAASHLTPADLSRVQGRAREWVKNHLANLSFDDPRRACLT